MGYAKTGKGQDVVKTRSIALAPRQRTLLLLCDGKRSAAELLGAVAGSAQGDLDELQVQGLVERPMSASRGAHAASHQVDVPVDMPAAPVDEAARYREAYAAATQLVAELGLRGFRLQLAVEGAMALKELAALAPKLREALEAAHGPQVAKVKLASFERAVRG